MDVCNKTGWRARDGWLCFVALSGSQLAAAVVMVVFYARWPWVFDIRSPQAAFLFALFGLLIMMVVTLAFARVPSLKVFLQRFRLDSCPTTLVGWGLLFGIGLAFVGLYFVHRGWVYDTALTRPFRYAEPRLRILLSLLLLIGPFLEEPIMRGFLYPAFRGSYGVPVSISIVVVMSLLTHPDALSTPGVYAFLTVSMNLVACLLRENTTSLWDCILCHLAYNGTLALADILQIARQE